MKISAYDLPYNTMKQNNPIIWTLVLILLSSSIFAQEDPYTFNPDDPSSFDYVSGDYTTINDWSKVEWNKVPAHRIPEVPADQLDYSQINAQQRLEMNVEQISNNLHNIENLATDVKEDRAREAIQQNYQVTVVSLGSNAKIVSNVLHAEFGEEDSFNLDGKPAWKLEIGDDGIIRVLEPTEIIEQKITQQDSFTLVTETRFTSQSGSVNAVQHLSFKNGQAYVREGDTATIGDYKIPAGNNPVDIYFEPTTKPTGNYISISENGLDIGTTQDKTVKIIPQPGNKLFNMVKRDYSTDPPTLVPSERDTLAITVSDGDGLEVISRTDSGKTPMFRHHDRNGETEIETGRMSFRIKDDNLRVTPPKPHPGKSGSIDMRNSVAFELTSDSESIQDTLWTSSSNRFITLRDGKKTAGNNVGLEVSDLIEPNMMKSIHDLRAKYPNIDFGFGVSPGLQQAYQKEGAGSAIPEDYTDISANMAQLFDEWLRDKPGVEKYISIVQFNTGDNAGATFPEVEFGERTADPAFVLQNPVRELEGPLDTMDHEFVHVLEKYIANKELSAINSEINQFRTSKEFQQKEIAFYDGILAEAKARGLDVDSPDFTLPPDLQQKMMSFDQETTQHIEEKALDAQYAKVVLSLADRIYRDRRFGDVLIQSDELSRNIGKPANAQDRYQAALSERNLNKKKFNANGIADLTFYLHTQAQNQDNPPVARERARQLEQQLNIIIEEQTALYPYSFKYRVSFAEASATYSELPSQRATRAKELAQLEFDRVMSTEPPNWLREQAEERYYKIMGGREGSYCQTNPCGSCLIYTLTCQKE